METLAEHFKRFKEQHQQAMKMLGHPVSGDANGSKSATDATREPSRQVKDSRQQT